MTTFSTRRSGFTLLEVLVYTAILSIVLGFSILSLFEFRDRATANRGRAAVSAESDFVMQKISWALLGATDVSEPAVDATSSVLSLAKFGFADNPIEIEAVDGAVFMTRGAGDPVPLTTANVDVGSLIFTHGEEVLAAPEFVNIMMTLSASSSESGSDSTTTLQTTIYLRQ